MSSYRTDAMNAAKDFIAEHLKEDIIDNLAERGETPKMLYDYPGAEEYTYGYSDTEYGPREAVSLLEDLDDYEETDRGIIGEGDWRDQLSATAAFTYRNAVVSFINDLLEEINQIDLETINDEVVEALKEQNSEGLKTIEGEDKIWFEEDEADYISSAFEEEYNEYIREEIESQINGILKREA